MGIIIDLILVAFLVLSIWMGYKKGLIDCLVKIASFAIAIILAFSLCAPVGNFISESTQIDETIAQTIEETLSSKVGEAQEEINTQNDNLPAVITDYIANQIKTATAQTQDAIAKEVSANVTQTIVNGIAFIGIFLITRFVLFFFRKIADSIAKIPLLKQVNEVGGIAYGILRGLFVVYLILAIISFIAPLISGTGISDVIASSFVTKLFYNNNLLLKILF